MEYHGPERRAHGGGTRLSDATRSILIGAVSGLIVGAVGYIAIVPVTLTEFRLQIEQLQRVTDKLSDDWEQYPVRLTIAEGRIANLETDAAKLREWLESLRDRQAAHIQSNTLHSVK